jgi:hypothetical protein
MFRHRTTVKFFALGQQGKNAFSKFSQKETPYLAPAKNIGMMSWGGVVSLWERQPPPLPTMPATKSGSGNFVPDDITAT